MSDASTRASGAGASRASASAVVLTRDAGPAFEETLARLMTQAPPLDEVIVVDSGSRDGTVERARDRGARVHAIEPAEFDFGRTRDLGFSLAQSELVLSLSQDVIPKGSDWAARLTALFADRAVAFASARCEARDPETLFLWQRMGRFYFTREMRRFTARYGTPCSNASSCVRRSVWEKLPMGPMPIAEDLLFQKRVVEAGYRTAQVAEATAWHQHAYTARTAFKRAFNEGHAARLLGIPYSALDALKDGLSPAIWLALAYQVRYGRVRSLADALYPVLRPAGVAAGRALGKRYWR